MNGFMRRFIDYETTAGGDELDLAGLIPDEVPAPEVEAGAVEAAAPGEDVAVPAAPTWTPSREELGQMISDTLAQQLGYMFSPTAPEAAPEPELDELDLYDPRTLAEFIQNSNQRAVEAALQPLMPVIQRSQAEQAEAQVSDWLNDAKEKAGGFEVEEQSDMAAAYFAHGMLPNTVDPFRAPNGDPERAIRDAVEFTKGYEQALMKKGEERYIARQQSLREQAATSPVGGPAVSSGLPATEVLVGQNGGDELDLARSIVSRINAGI